MIDFETEEEWTRFFEESFPDGALVTPVQTTEQAIPYDDSYQILTSRFLMEGMENGHPHVEFASVDTDQVFVADIDEVEERPYGFIFRLADRDQTVLQVSKNLSVFQKIVVQRRRENGSTS